MSTNLDIPNAYGGNGDMARARRQRRAFHFIILATTFFAGAMLLSEEQLRHSAPENQYRNGLTMHENSGRVMLRQAVRMLENDEKPIPLLYLQALAQREQEDMILETFERAFTMAPTDAMLNMRYGAHLFYFDQFSMARDRFADAALHSPKNALPLYQQAAAIAVGVPDHSAIPAAFEIMRRVDPTVQSITFPPVLWSPNLPRDSKGYQHWVAVGADRQCAPLIALARRTLNNLELLVAEHSAETAAEYVALLEQMARQVYRAEDLNAGSATAALAIEIDCLNARVDLAAQYDTLVPTDASVRLAKLRDAVTAVSTFNTSRDDLMNAQQRWLVLPMYRILEALFLISVLYVVVFWIYMIRKLLSGVEPAAPSAIALILLLSIPSILMAPLAAPIISLLSISSPWTLRTPTWVRVPLILGPVIMLVIMFWFTIVEPASVDVDGPLARANAMWRILFLLVSLWAIITPYFWLPSVREVEPDAEKRKPLRALRRWAAAALSLRQLGFVAGLLIIAFSVWGVGTRLLSGTYPHKYELIVSGHLEQENQILATYVHPLR